MALAARDRPLVLYCRSGGRAAGFARWGLCVGARADLLVIDTEDASLLGVPDDYLLDALAATEGPDVQVGLTDGNSSCLIRSSVDPNSRFVVMPMRL